MSSALQYVRATSVKTNPFSKGDKVQLVGEVVPREITISRDGKDTILNADYVVASCNGKNTTIPMSELVNSFKFLGADGKPQTILSMAGDNAKKVQIPTEFTVSEAEERQGMDGKPMYALANLEGSDEVMQNRITYNDFMKESPAPKKGAKPMCIFTCAL